MGNQAKGSGELLQDTATASFRAPGILQPIASGPYKRIHTNFTVSHAESG